MMIQTGYKATDKDGKCRGYQFSLPTQNADGSWAPGDWHEFDGDIKLCEAGFHWCKFPSGPWAYYSDKGVLIWVIEADQTAVEPVTPGADYKLVSKRIRLIRPVVVDGDYNTGNYNTGNRNTGNYNTGDCNTGDYNTGNRNTGNCNTGDYNTGDYNTGNRNTGNCNTGDYNTGNCNTGDCNTGNYNTGNRNTGSYNATNRSAGFFCIEEPKVLSFDVQTDLNYDEFCAKFPNYWRLGEALQKPDSITFEDYKDIPGITPEKLLALHKKFQKEAE